VTRAGAGPVAATIPPVGARSYLRRVWRYALAGAVPAVAWLVVVR
jgi:hypothetical protein